MNRVDKAFAHEGAPAPLRILMTHWDGGGNIPPQRALARELIRRGHAVHVLTHNSLASSVAADGATFEAYATAQQWDPTQHLTGEEERNGIFNIVASEPYPRDFLGVVERIAPDLCLIDAMMMATVSAADERGLRYATINHLGWNPDGAVSSALNGLAALSPAIPKGTTLFGLLERAPMVLATTYPELGAEPSRSLHVHFVGPIREAAEPAHWPRKWPERPFVLVSLSTINQQQEFLLAKLCEALAPLELEVLVTTGRGVAPESLAITGCLQARAFAPHDAVLNQADLTLSHGGLGTTMYSLGAGVPVLAIAEGRDQADNARRIETLGLGRALHPGADAAAIRTAVLDALADQALRDRCRAFASSVSRFGDLGRAATLVETFAARAAA